jgi:hypothetical protein
MDFVEIQESMLPRLSQSATTHKIMELDAGLWEEFLKIIFLSHVIVRTTLTRNSCPFFTTNFVYWAWIDAALNEVFFQIIFFHFHWIHFCYFLG